MRALYGKEARELGFLVIPLLVGISVAWISSLGLHDAFLSPRDESQGVVWLTASVAGILLAYWQFAGERARGTHAYLVHRGLRAADIVRAKALLGAGAAFLLGIVPPLVCAAWLAYVEGDGGAIQFARLQEYAVLALTGVSAYAVAAQHATSHHHEPGRAVARLLFVVAVVAAQYWLFLRLLWVWAQDLVGSGAVGLVGGVVAISVPALWIATRRFERGLDGSRPVAAREARVAAVTAAVFVLVPIWMFFGASERMLARNWLRGYPRILSRGGEQWTVGRYDSAQRVYLPLGEDASDVPDAEDNRWRPGYSPTHPWAEQRSLKHPKVLTSQVWNRLPSPDRAPLYQGLHKRFQVTAWILQPAGELRIWFAEQVFARGESGEPTPTPLAGTRSRVLTARRPDGVPLSSETVAEQAPDGRTVLLFDPLDHSLWRFAPERLEGALVPLELPDGREAEGFVWVEGAATRWSPSAVVAGDAAFVYMDGALRPIEELPDLSLWTASADPTFKREVRRDGLFEQSVVVSATSSGEELFRHTWRVGDGAGVPWRLWCTGLQALQGPLPIAIASYLAQGDPPFEARQISLGLALQVPFYFGGRFAWVLVLHAALALTLGVSVHRRARNGGLSPLRGGLWTAGVLIGGVWVAIVFGLHEPAARRKEREVETLPAPRKVLVVRTA